MVVLPGTRVLILWFVETQRKRGAGGSWSVIQVQLSHENPARFFSSPSAQVCTLNSITGGMLTWSVGILQKLEFRVTADSPLGGGRARQRWTEAVQLD